MKGKVRIFVVLGVILVALVLMVEEARMRVLRDRIAELEKSEVASSSSRANKVTAVEEVASKSEREEEGDSLEKKKSSLENLAKKVRKIASNPATKALLAAGHKSAVMRDYEAFIEELGLSGEEKEYFVRLMMDGLADKQRMNFGYLEIEDLEERKALREEMRKLEEEREAAMKDFLNSDEDYERFGSYRERLSEHRQMSGIKAAMSAAGADLEPEQEVQMIEAMYENRQESREIETGVKVPEGELLVGEGTVNAFEQNWEVSQTSLRMRLEGVLNQDQMEAFIESQEQKKSMQLMGLKMMQKMIENKEN